MTEGFTSQPAELDLPESDDVMASEPPYILGNVVRLPRVEDALLDEVLGRTSQDPVKSPVPAVVPNDLVKDADGLVGGDVQEARTIQEEVDTVLREVREKHGLKTLGVTVHNCESLEALRNHKGLVILCMAGFTQKGEIFSKVVRDFSKLGADTESTDDDAIIITIDTPGSQGTEFSTARLAQRRDVCTKEEYAAIGQEVMVALGGDDPIVPRIIIAHSFGGLAASGVFPNEPGIIRVLLAPAYRTTPLFQFNIRVLDAFHGIARHLPKSVQHFLVAALMNPHVPKEYIPQYAKQLFNLDKKAIRMVFEPLTQSVDPLEVLSEVQGPIIVVAPREDRIVDSSVTLRAGVHEQTVIQEPPGGHQSPMLTQPLADVIEHIKRYLDKEKE